MIVTIVEFRLETPIGEEEARSRAERTAPMYKDKPGLVLKQYLRGQDGMTTGAAYLWESRADAEACFDEEWHSRLTQKFGPPIIKWYDCPWLVDNRPSMTEA